VFIVAVVARSIPVNVTECEEIGNTETQVCGRLPKQSTLSAGLVDTPRYEPETGLDSCSGTAVCRPD